MKDIHIGTIIKQKVQEKSMNIGELANRINYSRTGVYTIFRQKSIDTELLINISTVLDYDFIHEVYFPRNNPIGTSRENLEESEIIKEMKNLFEKLQRVRKNDTIVTKNDTINDDL